MMPTYPTFSAQSFTRIRTDAPTLHPSGVRRATSLSDIAFDREHHLRIAHRLLDSDTDRPDILDELPTGPFPFSSRCSPRRKDRQKCRLLGTTSGGNRNTMRVRAATFRGDIAASPSPSASTGGRFERIAEIALSSTDSIPGELRAGRDHTRSRFGNPSNRSANVRPRQYGQPGRHFEGSVPTPFARSTAATAISAVPIISPRSTPAKLRISRMPRREVQRRKWSFDLRRARFITTSPARQPT
jgi:hypothetical protein